MTEAPAPDLDPRRWWTLVLALLAITIAVIDTTVLNVSVPGPFEPDMPGIVQWFTENPPGDAGA